MAVPRCEVGKVARGGGEGGRGGRASVMGKLVSCMGGGRERERKLMRETEENK